MNIFDLRNQLIGDYASYINSFIHIRDLRIRQYVEQKFQEGNLENNATSQHSLALYASLTYK